MRELIIIYKVNYLILHVWWHNFAPYLQVKSVNMQDNYVNMKDIYVDNLFREYFDLWITYEH